MNPDLKTEILINITAHETRVAVIENGLLQEIHIERHKQKGIAGNIYRGKVERVLPGMQAAFVNIGLEKSGFLHLSDVLPLKDTDSTETLQDLNIQDWLHEGEEVLVQVMKDPLGSKGARLTKHLSLASRYLVYMPDLPEIGVSTRLEKVKERERLKAALEHILGDASKGFIIRTAAEDASEEALAKDREFLEKLWEATQKKAKKVRTGTLIYEDLPLYKKVIRDMVHPFVEKIRVDDETIFEELLTFSKQLVPEAYEKLESIRSKTPLFERYGVEEELQRNLKRRVDLKSGGYLVIDQTEAMTTIDVNSGSFVGALSHSDTIFKTNLEAADMIARQLRLRNLGGIIVVDFIDMTLEEHRAQVLNVLNNAFLQDHSRVRVGQFTEFGLVQIIRKRTHESLLRELCQVCPECEGRGMVKTPETLAYEICRDLQREIEHYQPESGLLVVAAEEVISWLLEELPELLAELELTWGLPIRLKAESQYTREQYDIVPL